MLTNEKPPQEKALAVAENKSFEDDRELLYETHDESKLKVV